MKRIKTLSTTLITILTVGTMTASAALAESTPLPLIHTALPGEVYPINLSTLAEAAGSETAIALANANSKLPAEGVTILLVAKELTALGTATIDFTGIHTGAKKCSTVGDPSGFALVPSAEWHLVYTGLSPLSELETAMLFLFTPFIATCEAVETEVEGSFLGRVLDKPVAGLENDSVDSELHLHCSNLASGIQELSSYYNDKLELLENVLLKVNISGTGFANSCLEIKPTLLFQIETTSAGGNSALMFTILL